MTPASIWGLGRGVWAAVYGDDATAVVTTTGVYTVSGSDGEPRLLDRFSVITQIGPAVLSADGTMLAVAIAPKQIRRYDLVTGTIFSTARRPVDARTATADASAPTTVR